LELIQRLLLQPDLDDGERGDWKVVSWLMAVFTGFKDFKSGQGILMVIILFYSRKEK